MLGTLKELRKREKQAANRLRLWREMRGKEVTREALKAAVNKMFGISEIEPDGNPPP